MAFTRFSLILPCAAVFSLRMHKEDDDPFSWDHVRSTVLFVGSGRSGGSMFGALLDAHPRIVVSNEYDLVTRVAKGEYDCSANGIYGPLYHRSLKQAHHGRAGGGGYQYLLDTRWQGQALDNSPLIMGDKKAESTASMPFDTLVSALTTIANCTGRPLKIIHVGRNPFDVVGTRYVRELQKRQCRKEGKRGDPDCLGESNLTELLDAGKVKPITPDRKLLIKKIDTELANIQRVQQLIQLLDKSPYIFGVRAEVLDLKYSDLVAYPRKTLGKICRGLGIECDDDYLNACSKLVRKTDHYTRLYLEWDADSVCHMKNRAMLNPLLARWMTDPDPADSYDAAPRCGDACFPGAWPCPCAATNSTHLAYCRRQDGVQLSLAASRGLSA